MSVGRLAVLTSGGDAPGMNAAIWAVMKVAAARGIDVVGVERGFDGLVDGAFVDLTRRLADGSVAPISGLEGVAGTGGTFLGSSRSARFRDREGRAEAARRLADAGIGGLVVIGGNGSLTGAHLLATEGDVPVVGIPATIDNDVGGSTDAIGVDTALNTIIDACDRLSDTARSHHRAFIVEVMGRRSGYLAMASAVAAVADAVLLPEQPAPEDQVVEELERVLRWSFSPERNKPRVLVIKAEGVPTPVHRLAERLAGRVADLENVSVRTVVLGHLVRGGHPSFHDRLVAGRLARAAVDALVAGRSDVMAAWEPNVGEPSVDPKVGLVDLATMIEETERLLDGTSEVTVRRIRLMKEARAVLAL
ncbi:MAG TPA: ATP-dependent 6-phosphofructokinase [Actinobacteria bacterium]|nr:ATP-dependent 6-phosphofructokinase [Actinomycetota bacterium]